MSIKKRHILTLTTALCFGTVQGCIQRNVTCEEIKDGHLYRYPHECPPSSDVYVAINETMIAYRQGSKNGTATPEMKILNESFVKGNCTDLKIKCTFNDGGRVKDFCETYKTTDEPKKNPVHSDPQWGLKIGVPVGVLVILAIIVILVVFRRRIYALHVRKRNTVASCPISAPRGAFQNGNHDGHEVHQGSGSEVENELNTDIEMGVTQPAGDPCTDNDRNTTLERGQSTDPQPGGTTGILVSMEDETQAKDGDASVPDEVPNSRDMHRNQRDDPGGVNGIKAKDTVRIKIMMQNGWTHGERDAEDDEKNAKNEREPLLPTLGGANQPSDMTGEATARVDDSCFKPDPDSETSITLETDVESAHYMRNH